MSLVLFVLSFYFFLFFIVLLSLIFLWLRQKKPVTSNLSYPHVSILIAARDEENNIIDCLESIDRLDYPRDRMEVLIGNDQSKDQTEALVKDFIRERPNYTLFNITENLGRAKGKANVLAQLAKKAGGDFLFITDADVQIGTDWIKGLLSACTEKVGIVSGITLAKGGRYIEQFQTLDMAFAFGMVKVVSDLDIPVTAIGNNVMVPSKAYDATGGYEDIPFSVTEDFQLFREITQQGWHFKNLITPEVLSFTKPVRTFSQLLRQRKRWMYGALRLPVGLVIILTIQALFLPSILLLLCLFPLLALLFWAGKIILQQFFISLVLRKVNYKRNLFKYFLTYEFYSGTMSFVLLFYYLIPGKIAWKGRKY